MRACARVLGICGLTGAQDALNRDVTPTLKTHLAQIILNGKLTVTAGRDSFQCEAGPWTVLAAEAVTSDYGEYVPGKEAQALAS